MLLKNKNRHFFTTDTLPNQEDIKFEQEDKLIEEDSGDELEAINDYFSSFVDEFDINTNQNNRSIRNEDYSQRYSNQISSIKNTILLTIIFILINSVDFIPNIKLFPFSALPYISIFFTLLFLFLLIQKVKKSINEMALYAYPNTVKFVKKKTTTYSIFSIMLSLILSLEVFLYIWKYNLNSLFIVFSVVYFAIIFIMISKMFQERHRHLEYAKQKTTYY